MKFQLNTLTTVFLDIPEDAKPEEILERFESFLQHEATFQQKGFYGRWPERIIDYTAWKRGLYK